MIDPYEPLVEVFRSRRIEPCRERALVLRAMGIDFQMVRNGAGHGLYVREETAGPALEQLRLYENENRGWRWRDEGPLSLYRGAGGAAVYAAILIAFHLMATGRMAGVDWFGVGAVQAGAVREGEWWRTLTALCLHADLLHLAGNLFFGALFGALLSHAVGTGVAWTTALGAGSLGNLLNSWVQSPDHRSVGASTAIFGCVGALAAFQWRRKHYQELGRFQRWTPLVMGALLLGFLGMSGVRTDVIAHLAGFVVGLALGVPVEAWSRRAEPGWSLQLLLGLSSLGLLAVAWVEALRAG